MKLVIYGLTITSAWGNGHATTYRSLAKALARRGHTIRFIEKDLEWYRSNRDLPKPTFCSVRLYEDWEAEESSLVEEARDADAILVGSYFPDGIAATRALLATDCRPVLFYDIDTPITMSHMRLEGRCEYLEASLIPQYDSYLSFTGGPILEELVQRFGARRATPLYCSVDSGIYSPSPTRAEYVCDLSYLGTYASDRQPKLMELLNAPAKQMSDRSFLIAGAMYPVETEWSRNVGRITHVAPADHPAFYSSSRYSLNLTRADMVSAGWSPSVRLFEASACGAAIISDSWEGLEHFLTPGEEILLASNADDVCTILAEVTEGERKAIGMRAREHILAEHTSEHRASQFEAIVAACATPLRIAPQTTAAVTPVVLR
jgi:spore maturation protein CgeB